MPVPLRNAVYLASDRAFLVPALWLWRELTRLNTRADTDILLITEERQSQLPAGSSITVADLDFPRIDYPTNKRISVASYWRLAAPKYLQARYRRLLYVDIDVLPMSPHLFDCFDFDMCGAPLAACEHLPDEIKSGSDAYPRDFNAGIQLIDVGQFVAQRVAERTFDIIANHGEKLTWHDQSALNLALAGRWSALPLSYNFPPHALGTFLEKEDPPRLVHYYGPFKPWQLVSAYPGVPRRRELLWYVIRHGQLKLLFGGFNHRRALRMRRDHRNRKIAPELEARWRSLLAIPRIGLPG